MGSWFSSSKKCKVICIGLDNAGKSTIINYLKPTKMQELEVSATVGFQPEQFKYGNIEFTVFDMSGQFIYRDLWKYYYKEVVGVIFVIDSADDVRLCIAKDELEQVLQNQHFVDRPSPFLFFANKMDLSTAKSAAEIINSLELNKIIDRPYHIVRSNALTGEGIEEGMKWLHDTIHT